MLGVGRSRDTMAVSLISETTTNPQHIEKKKSRAISDSTPFDSFLHVPLIVNFSSAGCVRAQVPKSQLS
jgi:hypothetical protein